MIDVVGPRVDIGALVVPGSKIGSTEPIVAQKSPAARGQRALDLKQTKHTKSQPFKDLQHFIPASA